MDPVEARAPIAPVPEEAEEGLAAVAAPPSGGTPRSVASMGTAHFAGVTTDRLLFLACCCSYTGVMVVLFLGQKYIWFATLSALLLLFPSGLFLDRWRDLARGWPWDRSIDRFVYGFPLAYFCLYAQSITHHKGDAFQCSWYIGLHADGLRRATSAALYVSFLVAAISLASGALKIDCAANPGVARRVREGRRYTAFHTMFRASELSFRLAAGVFLCESLRVYTGAFKVSPPLFLCIPFACLLIVYTCIYQCANALGGNQLDRLLPCLVVSMVTLALNPLHFFARPGYTASAREANKWLSIVRVCELLVASGFVYTTAMRHVPAGICGPEEDGRQMLWRLGLAVQLTLVLSLLAHYMIMALHSKIRHSTCQSLVPHGAGDTGAVAFPRPGQQDLYVPPLGAGLCSAWVQLGGGLPLAIFAFEGLPQQLDEYEILRVLGGGAFGVVVRVRRAGGVGSLDPAAGAAPDGLWAMKLLNTRQPREQELARREARIYSKVWLNVHVLADDLARVGHPFIVRLHFWSSWDEPRQFFIREDGEAAPVRHPRSLPDRPPPTFHMALMMEHCDGSLEDYLCEHFRPSDAEWFARAVHLLAEIQLGLSFLHEQHIVYRDLKPENVLIVHRPTALGDVHCKLGDFGYGRLVNPGEEHPLSVAGTPYFAAPEMEARRAGVRLRVRQEEENALDSYSYGTVAFAMAKGPAYVQESQPDRMGPRRDHPRCHAARRGHMPPRMDHFGVAACQACQGCLLLAELREQLRGVDPEGHLADVVAGCVRWQPARRYSVRSLRGHELFQATDFDRLLRLEL